MMLLSSMLLSLLAELKYIWLLFLFKVELEHEYEYLKSGSVELLCCAGSWLLAEGHWGDALEERA